MDFSTQISTSNPGIDDIACGCEPQGHGWLRSGEVVRPSAAPPDWQPMAPSASSEAFLDPFHDDWPHWDDTPAASAARADGQSDGVSALRPLSPEIRSTD